MGDRGITGASGAFLAFGAMPMHGLRSSHRGPDVRSRYPSTSSVIPVSERVSWFWSSPPRHHRDELVANTPTNAALQRRKQRRRAGASTPATRGAHGNWGWTGVEALSRRARQLGEIHEGRRLDAMIATLERSNVECTPEGRSHRADLRRLIDAVDPDLDGSRARRVRWRFCSRQLARRRSERSAHTTSGPERRQRDVGEKPSASARSGSSRSKIASRSRRRSGPVQKRASLSAAVASSAAARP